MHLPPEEPCAGPWRVVSLRAVLRRLVDRVRTPVDVPVIVGVDGRSSSGKTSLARRLAAAVPSSAIVHTDEVAWRHSMFGWADLLIDGVLVPVRAGRAVSFRPPAWGTHQRPGAIRVPAGVELVIVEGVGVGRRDVSGLLDGLVWVQCDEQVIEDRERVRVANGEVTQEVQAAWRRERLRSWRQRPRGSELIW